MHLGLATPLDIDALRVHLFPRAPVWPRGLGASAITPLVEGLLAAGHQVSIYTLDLHVTTPIILRGSHLTVYVGQYRARARQRCFDLFRHEARQLADFIQADQPALVHAHWGYEFALGALLSGRPHLITLHDDPWKILRYQPDAYRVARLLLKQWVLWRGQHFTAVSPYLAAAFARSGCQPAVVPNAVPAGPGHARSLPAAGPLRVVSLLTEWSELKNASTALRAFQKVRRRLGTGVEYWLYGSDYAPDGPAHRWAQAQQLTEGVHFAGSVPHSTLLAHLPQFDLLLHPSREESFGMTLIEAMQAGVPVVAGRQSGAVPWVLGQGYYGVLTNINSADTLAAAVLSILTDAPAYARYSARGIAQVQQQFSAAAVVAAYEVQYRRVLAATATLPATLFPSPIAFPSTITAT